MKPRPNPFLRPARFVATLALSASPVAYAASQTWSSSTTGNWSDGTKWVGASAPGATSGLNNTNVATFSNAAGGTITIDSATQNIGGLLFSGAPGAYIIGSSGANAGNSLFLSSGGSIVAGATSGSSAFTINAPLVLAPASPTTAGTYSFTSTFASTPFTIAGNVTGGTTTLGITLNLDGTSVTRRGSTVSGSISDGGAAGGLAVTTVNNNFSSWSLSGNNSYTGVTTVNSRLNIRSANALGSTVGGTIVVANGNAALEFDNTGNAGSGITFAAEALSIAGTGNSGAGAIRNIAGINTYTGAVTLTGATTINSNSGKITFDVASGNAITATNQNLTLGGTAAGEVADAIAIGSGSLTKVDSGTWTLSANNSYSGLTTVSGGALSVTGSLNSGNALTVGASGTANFANASQNLGAVGNSNTTTNALNFSNATGTVVLASLTGSGNTRFGSNGTVTGGISTGTVTSVGNLNANISGGTTTAGGLLTGTVSSGTTSAGSLSSTSVTGGTNTITGAAGITSLNGGATTVGGVATIGTMTTGTVNLNGATSAIATLNGGTVNLGSTTLTVGNGTTSGAITGASGALTVTGALSLNGSNTYGGVTSISTGGDLRVNGTNSGSGAVNVASGANLGGSGSVIGGINVTGVLTPGNSIESLGGGALNFLTGSTYAYELQTDLFTGTPNVAGDLTYSSSSLSIAAGTILTLSDLGGSTALANGSKLTLISSVGAWNLGLFSYDAGAGLVTLNDDTNITIGANIWKFDYNDTLAGSNFTGDTTGANNFVTLTVVPEPNVSALIGGLGLLSLLRRRR